MPVLSVFLMMMVAGSLVYGLLTIIAAVAYRRVSPPRLRHRVPISILKPLAGVDEGLEANLRSFFAQQYGEFEILFAVHDAADPAIALVEKLRREFPAVPTQLIVSGDPPYPNAKVYSLDLMLQAARYEIVVMGDSDVRVSPRLLETLAREFQDDRVGLITCPYRAIAGRSFWSEMEAVFINTEFLGGILVARLLNGMDFALGPTIAVRKRALAKIGGFDFLKDYLAEDFVMGNRALAPARLHRAGLHQSVRGWPDRLGDPPGVVARIARYGTGARRLRVGTGRLGAARSADPALLVGRAAPGCLELSHLGGRLLW